MTPSRKFFRHLAAVSRPGQTNIAGTDHPTTSWSAVSGMSAIACVFLPRGSREVATPAGLVFAQVADIWVEAADLPAGGEIADGDRLAITHEGTARGTWQVASVERVNDGEERFFRCLGALLPP